MAKQPSPELLAAVEKLSGAIPVAKGISLPSEAVNANDPQACVQVSVLITFPDGKTLKIGASTGSDTLRRKLARAVGVKLGTNLMKDAVRAAVDRVEAVRASARGKADIRKLLAKLQKSEEIRKKNIGRDNLKRGIDSLKMVMDTLASMQANLTGDEVANMWNEACAKHIHDS